jgi:hypothetical protein
MVKRIEPLPETLPIFDTEYLDHKLIQDLWQIFIAFRQDPGRSSKIRPTGDIAMRVYTEKLRERGHGKKNKAIVLNIMHRYGFSERFKTGEKAYLRKFKEANKQKEESLKTEAQMHDELGKEVYEKAVKALAQGYGYKTVATRLNIPEDTAKSIYHSKPVQELIKDLRDKSLRKTETEIFEELMAENKEIKDKYTQMIPKLAQTVEDLQAKMDKYIEDPEAYGISHETVFKESLKIMRMFGEATDQLTPKKEVKGGQDEAYKIIIEMSQKNQLPSAEAEKLLEAKYQPPKLLE